MLFVLQSVWALPARQLAPTDKAQSVDRGRHSRAHRQPVRRKL